MTDEQLAFDIEAMLHESAVEAAPEWTGAPLSFTTAYWPAEQLDAAHEHWRFLHKLDESRTPNRMWLRAIAVPGRVAVGEHGLDFFTADLRCGPWTHPDLHRDCQCVGDLIYQAICEPHGWHVIAGDENSTVESWHDHAFPGWRDLPIVPARLRSADQPGLSNAAKKWIAEHYPRFDAGRRCSRHHRAQQLGHPSRSGPLTLGWLRHLTHGRGHRPEGARRLDRTPSYANQSHR